MKRRIFGIETEFGLAFMGNDGRRLLSADEVARYLFRKVVAWGRSSNIFLTNGSRLYLDVGSHPEYATAECDNVREAVIHDRAGELVLEDLADEAASLLSNDGFYGQVYLFKNNTDSAGNSYGCHENYLVHRTDDFTKVSDLLLPFLVTRQILLGAGKVLPTPRGSRFVLSQRAEHVWEGVSSATTRSRPIINTRDEPHADAEKFRRLHVIVGDSNMSETTNMLKLGSTDLVLRLIESGRAMPDFALENPIRAIREISTKLDSATLVKLANGSTATTLEIQQEYLSRVTDLVDQQGWNDPTTRQVVDLWRRGLQSFADNNFDAVDTELDWVIKRKVLYRYLDKLDTTLDDPRIARLELAFHDISRERGIFYKLERSGLAARVCTDDEIAAAVTTPPQTTRAKLRGDFVKKAQEADRDFTVDWVHLKLNDQSRRTVLCKDPFRSVDERVERLIESM